MTALRDLADLVPADVRAEVNTVIAVLETHGPATIDALWQFDRVTTAAWKAVNMVEATEDEWRLVERAVGIERAWDPVYRLVSTLDHLRRAAALPAVTPDGA
jgi:hypothetical protein